MPKKLLVIIPDRLSVIIAKGEITERYYNPGNLFDEVHILMINDDQLTPAAIQPMAGDAKLVLHNLNKPGFIKTVGYRPILLKNWVRKGIKLIEDIQPDLIRTHNNFLEGYLAVQAKRKLDIPFITSLHGVWDRDHLDSFTGIMFFLATYQFQRLTMQYAAHVIAVYGSIVRYAKRFGSKNIHLLYNIVSSEVQKKQKFTLNTPLKLITINRQLPQKNPENIIRAVKEIDCEYLLIGDGAYHEKLKQLVIDIGVDDRVEFIKALPNEKIAQMLQEYDLMVSHVDFVGMSKTVIEASLAGLPTIININPHETIPEYEGDWVIQCKNTPEGYREAILAFLEDQAYWQEQSEKAYQHAKNIFDPIVMEESVVRLYQDAMGENE